MRRSILLPTMARTIVCPMLALAALVALSLLSSVNAASSHSSWRLPSLLNRPLRKLSSSMVHHRHRRRHVEMTAASSPIKNAVFCVRGGGEGGSNGPCIGIDLGMSAYLVVFVCAPSLIYHLLTLDHQPYVIVIICVIYLCIIFPQERPTLVLPYGAMVASRSVPTNLAIASHPPTWHSRQINPGGRASLAMRQRTKPRRIPLILSLTSNASLGGRCPILPYSQI